MKTIKLYTTAGCHLCEQAYAMVSYLIKTDAELADLNLQLIDIVDDEQLLETYGVRIPVLKQNNSNTELGWPFELKELEEWIKFNA